MAKITATDRLIFTLVLSIILHLIVVLGVSFNLFSPPNDTPVNNLEITLVKHRDSTPPEEADYLAQADSEGGGETETPSPDPTPDLPVPLAEDKPTAEQPATATVDDAQPTPLDTAALTEIEPEAAAEPDPEPVVAEPQPEPEPEPAEAEIDAEPEPPQPRIAPPDQAVEKLTQQQAEREVVQAETPDNAAEAASEPEVQAVPRPSAREMMMQARQEINSLEDRLDRTTRALSERPKKRRISAATKEFAAAAYMKAWQDKVERIGNINYPEEARRKGITGNLMLSVDIMPDGSVPPGGIVISRSSGFRELDDAAVRIVRLGAPYAAIPDNVLKDNDMLTIIRTWKFESGRGLSTR